MSVAIALDPQTRESVETFSQRVRQSYPVERILLYGSRARGDHRSDSDADIAVLLSGDKRRTMDVALEMTKLTHDILLDTGLVISPFPIWIEEWEYPSRARNPWLVRAIKAEGVVL